MTLIHEEPLAILANRDVQVEAGATGEIPLVIASPAEEGGDGWREYTVAVRGLPEEWYTLSDRRVRVAAGAKVRLLLAVHPPRDDRAAPPGEYPFAIEVAAEHGKASLALEGRLQLLPPGGIALQSRLLQYLPNVYRDDTFLARFLLIFQSVLDPIDSTIGTTHHYLDPGLAPVDFLPWLASWVGLRLVPGLEEDQQRALIQRGVELSRWKGTRRGLREALKATTGAQPLIVENFDGMRLGQDACLGINTQLGVQFDQGITVTLVAKDAASLEARQAASLVEELKPAHVKHVVRLALLPDRPQGGGNG